MNKFDLEERLIDFTVNIIQISKSLHNDYIGLHIGKQIVRSGTSVSLNYGEAQSGESRKDFIHKMKIVLKELRETFVALKIIERAKLLKSDVRMEKTKSENNELISIFVKSIETAQRNLKQE